jgi:hypothetical protein
LLVLIFGSCTTKNVTANKSVSNKEEIPKNIKNTYYKDDVISNNKNTSLAINTNPTKSAVVRGEGKSKFGSIIVVPNGEEEVGTLSADSAYGKASDFTFNADYKIVVNY